MACAAVAAAAAWAAKRVALEGWVQAWAWKKVLARAWMREDGWGEWAEWAACLHE